MGAKWFYSTRDNKYYVTDKFGKLSMYISDGGQIGSNWSNEQRPNPDRMLYFQRTHTGTITAGRSMTGMMIAQSFKGAANSGNVDGIEVKSRGDSTNTAYDVDNMRAIVGNVDVKYTDVSTTAKCIESVIEGNAGSTIAEARAGTFKIQSSGTVTASYVLYAEGHSAVYADYGLYIRYVKRPFYAACSPSGSSHLKAFEMAITDSTTQSSGWNASFFVELTTSGAKSPSELAAGRFNHLIGGTVTGAMIGLKAKVGVSGSPTVTGAKIQGLHVSMDEVGDVTSTGTVAGIQVEMYNTSDIGHSYFLWCKQQGGSAKIDTMLGMWGLKPDNFLKLQNDNVNGFWDATHTAGDQCIGHIKLLIGTTTGYINIFSDNS